MNKFKSIIFLILILLVFFSFLELFLRVSHIFGAATACSQPDPVHGFTFIPHKNYFFFKENDHPIIGRINSFGWRDREWSTRKVPGTYRIAVLGDSYIEAFQVESKKTFLALVEKKFNKKYDLKLELMNFGRSGCTQTEEFLILQNHVEKFEPNMILLFFNPGNDIRDISRETAWGIRPYFYLNDDEKLILDTEFKNSPEYKIKYFLSWFRTRSALINFMVEKFLLIKNILRHKKEGARSKDPFRGDKIFMSLCTAAPDKKYLQNYNLNKVIIEHIAAHCKQKNYDLVLINQDNRAYLPEIETTYKAFDATFNHYYFEEDLQNLADTLNVKFIGLQKKFRKYYETEGEELHWVHWNYTGHEVVAQVLEQSLEEFLISGSE